jgi:thioesterase domain-containing protein/acyl carrier protein
MMPSTVSTTPSDTSSMDELERQLTRIWEAVLGKRGIGIRDSFWDLGGHSFIALRMVRRIEKQLGKTLPLATFLQVSTIEELAKLIRDTGWLPAWSSLVAIQPHGSNPPFFCVHGIGGMIMGFRDLALHLGAEQPMYGLQAQGVDGKRPPFARVEDMASLYVQEVRRVQPRGPYLLGGLSFGGWVAYEMAQQLRTQGELVGFLGLFDTYTTNWSKPKLFLKLFRLPPQQGLALVYQRAARYVREAKINVETLFLPRHLKQVRRALHQASDAYVPKPYFGKITFFRASQKSIRNSDDPKSGWGELACGELDIHDVRGDHNNLLVEPQVSILAQELKAGLEKAREEFPMQDPSPPRDEPSRDARPTLRP